MSQEMRRLLDGGTECSAGFPMHEYREDGGVALYYHLRNGTRARCHGALCKVVGWVAFMTGQNVSRVQRDAEDSVVLTWSRTEDPSMLVVACTGVALPMVLYCPQCSRQHIDEPDPDNGWLNPPHRTHLCHGCGHLWRPASVPTTGVKELPREVA